MKKYMLFLIAALMMASCNTQLEEEISWDLDKYPDLLVVEGSVTNELKNHMITLSLTNPYFSTDTPAPVSNAEVTVTEGMVTYTFSESETNKGTYLSDLSFAGEPTKEYTLNITLQQPVNGQTRYSASSVMPHGISINRMICNIYELPDLIFDNGDDDEEKDTTILSINFYGKEPDDPDNYYLAEVYRNNIPWQSTAKEISRFTDDYSNGTTSNFILFAKNVESHDTIRLILYSVSADYYDFIGGIQQMDQSGNAYNMSGPPANAVGNIQYALGFFSACFVSENESTAIDMRNKEE